MSDSTPDYVEPAQEFLGFECAKCRRTFALVGPLDLVEMPPDRPLRIGARGPIPAECPHCAHRADYPIDQLRRFRA